MSGPCLCGDPYCPFCGDPSRAEYEAIVEQMMDRIDDAGMDEHELIVFFNAGLCAVMNARDLLASRRQDMEEERLFRQFADMYGGPR